MDLSPSHRSLGASSVMIATAAESNPSCFSSTPLMDAESTLVPSYLRLVSPPLSITTPAASHPLTVTLPRQPLGAHQVLREPIQSPAYRTLQNRSSSVQNRHCWRKRLRRSHPTRRRMDRGERLCGHCLCRRGTSTEAAHDRRSRRCRAGGVRDAGERRGRCVGGAGTTLVDAV